MTAALRGTGITRIAIAGHNRRFGAGRSFGGGRVYGSAEGLRGNRGNTDPVGVPGAVRSLDGSRGYGARANHHERNYGTG